MHDDLAKQIDVRLLIRWLGIDAAKTALDRSNKCTLTLLKEIAGDFGIHATAKATRKELIDDVVRVAGRRIDKPLDQLFAMEQHELIEYFKAVEVESEELLALLKDLNLNPGRQSRGRLLEFVARELAETGRFMRISGKHERRSDEAKRPETTTG